MGERLFRLTVVLALAAVTACAAPSSFDGLTGGPAPKKEDLLRAADPTLDAPRPISPVSVSWVSTSRPTFSWKTSARSTGAVVELCRTRACDGEDVRRIEVEGETVTVPDDLEPGFWFWRLYGMSKERVGTKPSATWEVVVRGPGIKGASDKPAGGIVDVDGDGYPDILITSHEGGFNPIAGKYSMWPTIDVLFGSKDGTFHSRDIPVLASFAEAGEDAVAGGVDVDGDGFTDVAHSLKSSKTGEFSVGIWFGGEPKRREDDFGVMIDIFDFSKQGGIATPGVETRPLMREGGDVNGDGYGDFLVAAPTVAVAALGGAKGTTSSMPLFFGGGQFGTDAVVGAFDVDGDGLSDVAFSSMGDSSPISAARGDRERISNRTSLLTEYGVVEKVVALASGDFNGDGAADVAATVVISGRRHICFWIANAEKVFPTSMCLEGPMGDDTYGTNLTAGDLAGKGKDDLLVSGGSGASSFVQVYGLDSDYALMIDRIETDGIGAALTTIWPGRPGKARWAALDTSRTTLHVFEGKNEVQSILMVQRSSHDFVSPVHSLR